jgi:hypothetical protein
VPESVKRSAFTRLRMFLAKHWRENEADLLFCTLFKIQVTPSECEYFTHLRGAEKEQTCQTHPAKCS